MMRLVGYTLAKNEAAMIPYVMPYIERMGYDKFVVLDNGSDDGTRELLESYGHDWLEVRDFSGHTENFERMKSAMYTGVCESFQYMNEHPDDIVFYTWTDFDEVIYCSHTSGAKGILSIMYGMFGCNCFDDEMLDLVMPAELERTFTPCGQLVHSLPGMRAARWGGHAQKCSMVALNDFAALQYTTGNHQLYAQPRDGKRFISLNESGYFHQFHLKYLSEKLMNGRARKWKGDGGEPEKELESQADFRLNARLGMSFPLELHWHAMSTRRSPQFGVMEFGDE